MPSEKQIVEAFAVVIEEPLVVLEPAFNRQSARQPAIEVDDVRVNVVQDGAIRGDSERDRESTAERLYEP